MDANSLPAHRTAITSCDAEHERMMQSVTRNLGLIYLAEGRVDEARPLLRACLETCERELQPDMPGGHESVELILPLMLMSYADMLAGKANPSVLVDASYPRTRSLTTGIILILCTSPTPQDSSY